MAIRELRAHLAELLRRVRGGETVVVTHRGRAVAEIRPVPPPEKDDLKAVLADWEREGRLRLPTRSDVTPFDPIPLRGPPVSEAIVEDREDRF